MAADSFEIKKVWIPLGKNIAPDNEHAGYVLTPLSDAKAEEAWQKATELAKEGWDLLAQYLLQEA